MGTRTVKLAAAAILVIMAVVMVLSSLSDSPTCDEVVYLTAGYSYLSHGVYQQEPVHPPLLKDLIGAPLVLAGFNYPQRLPATADPIAAFLYDSRNDVDRLTLLGRLPIMVLTLLLGVAIFAWSRSLWGDSAGLLGLALYAFNTTVIAHGRLATTDLGVALFMFLAVWTLYRYIESPKASRLALFGAALGFSLLSKMSAIVLFPAVGLLACALPFRASAPRPRLIARERAVAGRLTVFADWACAFGLATLVALALIYAVFFLHTLNTPPNITAAAMDRFGLSASGTRVVESLVATALGRPVVQFAASLMGSLSNANANAHVAFLLGEIARRSWWYYYFVALALKTQLALLIMAVVAIVIRRRLPRLDWFGELVLLVVPLLMAVAGMTSKIDIGVRYMLPVFPFIFVSLARLAKVFDAPATEAESSDRRPKRRAESPALRWVVGGLVAWYALAGLLAFPHYIAYFNEAIGGYPEGYRYLRDSNCDWGQDSKRLAEWADSHDVDVIYTDLFAARPDYYLPGRVRFWSAEMGRPDGILAVSVNQLMFARAKHDAEGTPDYRWLEKLKPIGRVGGSIFIYDCE